MNANHPPSTELTKLAVKREKLNAMVHRLEEFSASRPGAYKFRVILLAALGYVYLGLILALLMGLVGGLLYLMLHSGRIHGGEIKLLIFLGIIIYVILRALWVRIQPPEGIPLKRAEVPVFYELLDRLTRAVKAPSFHHVLLNNEFNASVVSVPRLGVFGWPRHYLVIGYPLLQALSAEQFTAVLAHEIGHLSGQHGRFSTWIYRVRMTWLQLLEQLQHHQTWGSLLFTPFFKWYAPFFGAYSFVLARAQEYEADRFSSAFLESRHAVDALVIFSVKIRWTDEKFWPAILKEAQNQPAPPADVFARLATFLHQPAPTETAMPWVVQSLCEPTGTTDTHPSLSDRLQTLGHPMTVQALTANEATVSRWLQPPAHSAAEIFLGRSRPVLEQILGQWWTGLVSAFWVDKHRQFQKMREQLKFLAERAQKEKLPLPEAFEYAEFTNELVSEEAAYPLLAEVLALKPDHLEAQFMIGRYLLKKGDETGLSHLQFVMDRDSTSVQVGSALCYSFLMERGRTEEAAACRRRMEQFEDTMALATKERSAVTAKDRFGPHGLELNEVKEIVSRLLDHPAVDKAYLVRKAVQHLSDKPFCVLLICRFRKWWEIESDPRDQQLLQAVLQTYQVRPTPQNQPCYFLIANKHSGKIAKKILTVEGALVFDRARLASKPGAPPC